MFKNESEKLINYFIEKSKSYDLEVGILNDTMLKVFSKQFAFDDWLIEIDDKKKEIILWHFSKKQNYTGKCSYHIQRVFNYNEKYKVLKTIIEHSKFKAFKKYKINLVDKILCKK